MPPAGGAALFAGMSRIKSVIGIKWPEVKFCLKFGSSCSYGSSRAWSFGPPIKHENSGGAGLRARQAVRTGWKACATGRTFQEQGQAGGRVLTPADASRESQPLRLVQAKTQPEAAEKLGQQCLKEQQAREKLPWQERQLQRQPDMKRMRGPMPEAAPPKPATSRFGAGVIRDKESADGD
jgi:hypothetical protein